MALALAVLVALALAVQTHWQAEAASAVAPGGARRGIILRLSAAPEATVSG